ncbi:MAG: 6-phosphogluconolactonase, partial [Mucinivorans sp.]
MSANYKLHSEGGLKKGAEPLDIVSRFERIPTNIHLTADQGSNYVAAQIAQTIRAKESAGEKCVLALSSGKSPVGVYRELVRMHNDEKLSFKNVVVFTIFEYYPIAQDERQSYTHLLSEELFSHVDILPENIHLLRGDVSQGEISAYCRSYEHLILKNGGIDILLLGIGEDGQIALNEAGSYINTRTRIVALSNASRKIVSNQFYGIDNVPTRALTMGIGTIMAARRLFVLAWGEEKAEGIARVVEGEMDVAIPATALQEHPHIEVVIDEDAASLLTRVNTPWLVGSCHWTNRFVRKAVLWLCQKVDKPLLKLTYKDYI